MAGEDQVNDEFSPDVQVEPTFRYNDLTFEEANRGKYKQYRRLTITLKQNLTKYINAGLADLKKKLFCEF